jgi:hypothetical protein
MNSGFVEIGFNLFMVHGGNIHWGLLEGLWISHGLAFLWGLEELLLVKGHELWCGLVDL